MDKYTKKTTIDQFPSLTRKVASEGIVLLKNINNVLPILETDKVSLFGRCQIDTYRSGTGSGGAVNILYSVNALEGLMNANVTLNHSLVKTYQKFIEENPFDNGGGGWAAEPWHQKELELTDELVIDAANQSNKAIIFIGRTAGEDKDHHAEAGSYKLTETELKMIDTVTTYFENVVLVYNVGNIVDMGYLSEYGDKIQSILYSWQGGMEGGNALADVLVGAVSPSGKLPDTIAKSLSDYPSFSNFGNDKENFYEEDIYVGYRYFETFNKDAVLFPFGYGLSYTTFNLNCVHFSKNTDTVSIKIEVTNTGSTTGKEVVQIYSEAPQGKLGKPYISLVDFAKTKQLQPNESQIITFEIPLEVFASYDDGGYTNHKSAYVLEEGSYVIHFGPDSRNLNTAGTFDIIKTYVTEQLSESLAPIQDMKRMVPGKRKPNGDYTISFKSVPKRSIDLQERIMNNLPTDIPIIGNQNISFQDVWKQKNTLEEFVSQLSIEELSLIVLGEGMSNPLVTHGTAAAFGGLYQSLQDYGIPAACAADGPSGLRMDSGHKGTQMPIGTLIASTWNQELIEEMYVLEGKELYLNNVDTLLGPGMNIHRHPLCGRNFEYFSEDPFLSGKIAAACVRGIHKGGSSATLKHYAANDQEKQRHHIDAVASERCLREIHLKGFEIAVKESNPISIMTAYNPINGHQAASNYDLNTTILRNEWGFSGLVMTDWWAQMNHNANPGEKKNSNVGYMIRSQNDLYMVIPNYGASTSPHRENIITQIETNELSIGELQRSAINILSFILQSPVMERPIKSIPVMTIEPTNDTPKQKEILIGKFQFNTKSNTSGWLELDSNGVYSVEVDMRYDKSSLAQSSCNLYINDQFIQNIQMNGNNNAWTKEHVSKIKIKKGNHKLTLEFTKPGLEIGTINIVKTEA